MKISVVRDILEANERIAQQNRDLFIKNGLLVINLMSSPGAGKTSLLEKTIDNLKDNIKIGVIEGDIQSTHDAEKIASKGIPTVQINTGGACHLDGNMIRDTFKEFDFKLMDLLVVENVGNLVCPAEFRRFSMIWTGNIKKPILSYAGQEQQQWRKSKLLERALFSYRFLLLRIITRF